MVGLLYFGRLEAEKGIDAVIEMIETFEKKNQKIPFELFVFGSGSREKKIEELANKYQNIHFFGRQPLATIQRYVVNCSYALIPSECIETFGLSALNALQRGLQPIGYAKGGLQDFIVKDYDLTHQPGKTTGQKLYHQINNLPNTPAQIPQLHQYSKNHRIVNFHTLAGKQVQKILIVSDFINNIGGIETYINDVKTILEPHGYEIILCGAKIPGGIMGRFLKYLGFVTGIANIRAAYKVYRNIKQQQPDLIRYHSTMRYLGWMPIRVSKYSTAKKWMMFHDLGYFAPFPSSLFQQKQIRTPFTLRHFMQTQPTKNPIKLLAIIGKYITLSLIKQQLTHKIDTFLIPSAFMQDIIHSSYKIQNEKIKVFPHFIQN